jgi:antitoxin (DNA-binding transcriptional repressor) of toxin-antitoxin stability system
VEAIAMVRVSTSKARQDFSKTLKMARSGRRVVLHRHDEDVAAIVSMEDLALLKALEDRLDVEAIREALKDPETIPWERVKAELGLA